MVVCKVELKVQPGHLTVLVPLYTHRKGMKLLTEVCPMLLWTVWENVEDTSNFLCGRSLTCKNN